MKRRLRFFAQLLFALRMFHMLQKARYRLVSVPPRCVTD